MGKPQSPIEEMFLEAFKRWALGPPDAVLTEESDGWAVSSAGFHVYIIPQAAVGPYRADFGIVGRRGLELRAIAVELDGHEFHEKTKEQVARDKRRDRHFTRLGVAVVRFTGSEVHRDADNCVAEAMACLLSQPLKVLAGEPK